MWEIKGKDNQTKAPVYALEYNGEWMGESYVTVTIESPTPIDFAIGDYLMYRGERFEINYDPGKIKSAPRFAKGDAFKYENVKFNSLADELTRCDFRDVVLQDNNLHFTSLPKFPFFGGVQDLANRIQANLDKLYTGANKWSVVVSPEFQGGKELNVLVDNIKVQGALEILVNQFETYYTIKGRTITIGAAGVPAGHLFKYGKGNGLYEIEQNAEADQAIVTRLRAYGSTRNLPHRYYNSLTGADGQKLIPDNMAVQYLMLPSFPYTTQDPYIDSANKATLGIREGTIFFDGSQEGLEEIYPSIEGMTAEQLKAAGVPCNSTGALDVIVSAEQMTDDGVGDINEGETETTATPPTFKVTLKDLGFNLWDYRVASEAPVLSFKTGMLGGRDFEIVDCKKEGNNYVLELNRVYDDAIKLWFPYKDYNAKGLQQNADNPDKFVLLHIEMPEVYIKAAAQRLLETATAWLAKNDYSRSVYAPKVDEIFMARQHDEAMASAGKITSLHDTLKEGMMLLFEDDDLNIDASIFIDRLTIKEGDGPVPTYEVVLKEEKTVGRLDKMQNQIDSLASGGQGGGYTAAQIRQMIDAYGGSRFLSKLKDDRAKGKIASDMGFEIGKYLAGASGGMFGIDKETGDSFAEVMKLYVRGKAFFETLTIIEANTLAGKQYITPGGSIKCTKVEEVKNDAGVVTAYRCYFLSEQDGEKTDTKIVAGDQVISEMFNAKTGTSNKVSNHRYWRLVTAVNNDAYTDESGNHYGYIDLSKTDCEIGSYIPKEGDAIDQFGNRTDATRQSAMVFSTVDSDSPSIKMYAGIGSGNTNAEHYSLTDKAIISFGREATTGKVYFRLGATSATQYLDYRQGDGLRLAGKLAVNSTIDGKTLENYFKSLIPELTQKDIEGFVNNIVGPQLEGIQDQIDGVIESFFGFGAPTLTNYPANEWTTDEARKAHERDTYTDKTEYVDDVTTPTAGQSWKWQYTSPTDYGWVKIADSDAVKALLDAAKAQDTANNKRRIFIQQPAPPYDKGDLWVNATHPSDTTAVTRDPSKNKYYNDILRCGTSRATGSFAIGDWGLSSNYTDDTLAQTAIDRIAGYEYLKNALLPENPTQITGGLIMSTLISLGYTDASNIRHTLAGMNGSWVDTLGGRTIGSWWGGPMVDLFDVNDVKKNLAAGSYATSLIRMDGTGYFVDGLFRIKKTGLEIGDTANGYGISMGMDGRLIMGNGININIGGSAQGLAASIESVTNLATKLSNLFTPYLGNTPKTWAEVSIPGTHFDSVKVNVGLWTDSFLSCLGKSDTGGSGGGGGGLVENIYRWADLGGTFSDADNDTFNAYTLNRIYSELTAADSAISARLANFYTKSEADGRYALSSALANYVTLNTEQTITARKNFSDRLQFVNTAPTAASTARAMAILWHTTSDTAYAATTLSVGSMTTKDADGNISSRYLYLGWGTAPWVGANCLAVGKDIFQYKGNDILHAYNYAAILDGRYVKKSGDTMSGPLTIATGSDAKIIIDNTDDETYWNFISFRDKGVEYGRLGTQGGTNISWNGNLIFHGGNYASLLDQRYLLKSAYTAADVLAKIKTVDGAASGLDADLLDGVHASEFARGGMAYIANPPAGPAWVRIATVSSDSMGIISINNFFSNVASQGITFSFSTSYRTSNASAASITQLGGSHGVISKARIVYPTGSSAPYYIEVYYAPTGADNHLYVRLTNACKAELIQTYTAGAVPEGYASKEVEFVRGMAAENVKASAFIGALNGNAATATRLQGTYKLWGQDFYGNNVSGNMTGVGTITASGEIKSTAPSGFRIAYANYGLILRNDGNNSYFLLTDSGDANGGFNSLRPFLINNATGRVSMNNGMSASTATISGLLTAQGGVQIGATADYGWYLNSSRLVAGTGVARGVNVGSLLVSNAWADAAKVPANGIYVKGALRIGDITIEEDKVNGGLHIVGGGLYADTFISALGVNPNDGSGTGGGGGMSYDRLDAWADYSADKAGYVLSALLGNDLYQNKLDKTEAQSLYQPKGSYLTAITKAQVETVLTGNITTHTHTFASLTSKPTTINGYGITDAMRFDKYDTYVGARFPNSDMAAKAGETYIEFWGNGKYFNFKAGKYIVNGGTSSQFLKADGSVDSNSYLLSSAYTASDILNKLKTVDGTGSGLDADLLDGYHETVFVRDRDLGSRSDYRHVVFLLWKDSEIANHHIQGKLFTMGGGSLRYQAAAIDIWFSRWSATGYDWKGRFDTWGLGTMMRLVTCTYNGEKWWAVEHTNTQAINLYFTGTARNVAWTKVHYYTSNTSTVVNSEIYSSREAVEVGTYTVNGIKNALVSDTVANASALGGISASEYLTKSNYAATLDGRYVNKAGDTITGVLTFQSGTDTKLIFNNTDGEKYTQISFREGGTEYSSIIARKDEVVFTSLPVTAKYFQADTTTLCPKLNADLLDGYHGSDYLRSFWTASPGYDCDTITNRRSFCSFTYKNNAPFNGGFVDVNANGYGFYLGTAYNSDQPLYYRRHGITGDGGMGAWQQLARITDNVASATKLQTARTLWGRSFDGTANVSGDMTGVGSITATGSISLSASSVLQFKEAGYGDKFGIWGDFNGYDDENRMYIGSATGAAGTDPALSAKLTMLLASGYIGLGTGSPTHRLHVNGYVRANGLTLDGSHLLEWDAANEAWKFNGNLYATGGLSALGVTELSATEASVESLKAKSILFNDSSNAFVRYISNILWIGNMSGMIMFGDNQQSGSQIIMTNTLAFGGQKTSSGSSYYIDPSGDAVLKSLNVRSRITAASVALKTAEFTTEGTEIYVTINETKYKLVKTAVS